ncbi:TetR/AcrR family transcriptional regulator [Kitasatospora atroaurantiaca]|uniref:TetR family transcriptional regulator n=1 Tax=Kitasatospora atroaurantiaca TaxID=285545 RepID=A0A561F1A1_9ACTN|nr:TetR/AcrR family transcriptional regulator [Kitasatospora atroaurantiaca]TWE21645.1 TetR family transcriptional regulator [Kitasatospora atroaurantiaca]
MRQTTGTYGGRSAQERRAERRERFLQAGLEQFGDKPGFRAASVTALCEAAGLSTRQFYEEFRNLEEVLAQLHLLVNDWTEEAVLRALADTGGLAFEQRIAAVLRAYVTEATADPRRLRIAFVEIIGVSAELERQRLVRRSRWVALIVAEAEAAVGRGEAAPRDFRIAATAFIGAVNGLLHDWTAGQFEATLEQVVEELVALLLGAVRPPSARP